MRINTPDVNLIIYFNFPLSLGQYVQESKRAGGDGRKAKSVIFYSKSELKFLYGIISGKKKKNTNVYNNGCFLIMHGPLIQFQFLLVVIVAIVNVKKQIILNWSM
ncbi:MAG: hypothetical protein QOK71_10425 [Nitrososphaeraceae archaeon]|nr:hypothetical protein [Nitrososphaeraceae archaeon]